MKSLFSSQWKASKQVRKQRKYRMNAPTHTKRTFMAAMLEKKLSEKHGRKSIELRKGDEVKVMRGSFKNRQGKVSIVDVRNTRIQIDGLQRTKRGSEKLITWFHPSKVKIISLYDSDKRRFNLVKEGAK